MAGVVLMGTITFGSQNNTVQSENTKDNYSIDGKNCSKKSYSQYVKRLKGKALKWSFVDNTKSNRKKIK